MHEGAQVGVLQQGDDRRRLGDVVGKRDLAAWGLGRLSALQVLCALSGADRRAILVGQVDDLVIEHHQVVCTSAAAPAAAIQVLDAFDTSTIKGLAGFLVGAKDVRQGSIQVFTGVLWIQQLVGQFLAGADVEVIERALLHLVRQQQLADRIQCMGLLSQRLIPVQEVCDVLIRDVHLVDGALFLGLPTVNSQDSLQLGGVGPGRMPAGALPGLWLAIGINMLDLHRPGGTILAGFEVQHLIAATKAMNDAARLEILGQRLVGRQGFAITFETTKQARRQLLAVALGNALVFSEVQAVPI